MRFVIAAALMLSVVLIWSLGFFDQKSPKQLSQEVVEQKQLLVSIHPLAMITAALTQGVQDLDIQVLLPSGASPHTYALKPSDVYKIRQADLVFWIGPQMESFLEKPLSGHKNAVAIESITEMPVRHYAKTEHGHGTSHDNHHHIGVDQHFWLGVPQVHVIARYLLQQLINLLPAREKELTANYQAFQRELIHTDEACKVRLSAVRDQGYFVFHDAYGYWQDHYRLPALGFFTVSPERQVGAKRLDQIRRHLLAQKARCIFAEPQFEPAIIDSIAKETGAKIITLDPLGEHIKLGARSYMEFLEYMTEQFEQCLIPQY